MHLFHATSTYSLPGIGESWIAEDFIVSECFKECDKVQALCPREGESGDEFVLVWVIVADSGVRPSGDGSAAGGVVIQHAVKRWDTAVVHVGRGKLRCSAAWES